jgi:hypothetical protein
VYISVFIEFTTDVIRENLMQEDLFYMTWKLRSNLRIDRNICNLNHNDIIILAI